MNKAFLREPDETGELNCPRCGSLGVSVQRETWECHLKSEAQTLASSAFFCPYPLCEVVYFDMFERVATTEALLHPVYPKDPAAPLCGCFGLTADDIEADLQEGTPTRVRELLAKSKTPAAQCTTQAVNGHCCVPEVQRYYMKRRGEV
jgi:Zinc binding domain